MTQTIINRVIQAALFLYYACTGAAFTMMTAAFTERRGLSDLDPAMFSRHADILATDWLSDFRRGILHVAGNTQDERDFLYFMLGMLYAANDEDTHRRWPNP